MENIFHKIKLTWQDPGLRRRIFVVLAVLAVFRLGAAIPVPGVNAAALARFFSGNQFFGLLNVFSGGGLSNLSLFMLGVGPYITASIIMQLLTIMFPAIKRIYQEEGEAGRRKFIQYSRVLTLPIAALQGFGLLALLQSQGVISPLGLGERLLNVLLVVAGAIFLMWLGELISDYGLGNGISLLIMTGIVARIPAAIGQISVNFVAADLPVYLAFLAATILIIALVVFITEAERAVPVTYAKRVRGNRVYGGSSSYLPLRLNQAGVMPIIFALSLLLFPQMIFNFLAHVNNAFLVKVSAWGLNLLTNQWFYGAAYFVLVVLFTYFYSAITFDPESIAENLQKNGAFIPGTRPGRPTALYLSSVLYRLTLFGSLFLGVIALLPLIMRALTGLAALAIGGTALLIVVSVAIEFMKQWESQLSLREY
jgi:preprotein translocase subunit SecY